MESPQIDLEVQTESEILLYPNPASRLVQIAGASDLDVVSIEIYDSMGRLMKRTMNDTSLDVSFLNEGVYALKLDTSNGIVSKLLYVTKK
jgi:hypothetical protein